MLTRSTIKNFKPVEHDPFALPEIQRIVPAIQPQIEIFTSCFLGGENASRSYNESISLHLSGKFNHQAMVQAVQDVVKRHEALRATFNADGTQIFIHKFSDVNIFFQDLSGAHEDQHQKFIKEFNTKDAHTSFDLMNGPLFRVAIFKLCEQVHYLTLSAHHIICDGWSLGIFMQDLSKFYSAYASHDHTVQWKEAPQLSDYAIEHRKFCESPDYKKTELFWLDQFKNNVPVLSVPTDFPRPSIRTYESLREDFELDPQLVSSIKKLGAKAGSSFVTTFLALFELYLHRLSNQEDIVVGMPAAGQSVTGNHELICHCVNMLPLRSKFEGDDNFFQFLQKQQRFILDAFDHQQFTFSNLLKRMSIPRDPSRIPLIPIVFNVDMGMDNGVQFHELQHRLISNPRVYETFEIFVNASGSEKKMILEWSYNTQLFKPATIRRMMSSFESLIKEIIENPSNRINRSSLQSFTSSHQEVKYWKNAESYPKEKSVHQLISEKAAEYPKNAAVYFHGRMVSYLEINEKANQLAALLIQEGVRVGDSIGLAFERSDKIVVALLAIMKSGAVYVPLDPEYPKYRIEFVLEDSSPKILLTSKKFKRVYKTNAKEIIIEDIWPTLKHYPKRNPDVTVVGTDLAYILYTSGSTGSPKGVKVAHYNLVNFLYSFKNILSITSEDKLLGITTLSFDISGLEIYLPLINGASIAIVATEIAKDGRLLLDAIKSERPTIMQATPATWQMLLEAGWGEDCIIKTVCSGGETLSKELANKLNNRAKNVYNLYGPTETTIWSTVKKVNTEDKIITIGHPISNTQVYILDENLVPVGENLIGEICISGDGVSKGYLNRPALTQERFIKNPFSKEGSDEMYRTGDLGTILPNGEIQCLGRIDQQVKIRGHRIEPGEIEHCLIKNKNMQSAVVVAREDRPGDQRLVAYIVPKPASAYDTNGVSAGQIAILKEALSQFLPQYMIPNDFVILKSLPLTPNGKIDRNALPRPGYNNFKEKKYIAPRSEEEKWIAGIWSKLLGHEKISIDDDFFEIGGHSFIAVQMMIQLEKQTGIRVPPSILFECSSIEKLAARLHPGSRTFDWKCLVPIKKSGSRPPVYIVHGIGGHILFFNTLIKHMHVEQPVYGLQAKGFNGNETILNRIEDMAAHYISEILEQNPEGPYLLAGYCYGGIIAYEMAHQLRALGKEVKMLALFETYAGLISPSSKWIERISKKMKFSFMQFLYTFVLLSRDPKTKIRYEKNELVKEMRISYRRFKMLLGMKKKDTIYYKYEIEKQNKIAAKYYQLTPYNGTIDLFRCGNHSFYMDDFEYLGWKAYAKGINVHDVPGDHNRIFKKPFDSTFAKTLQTCIDQVDISITKKTFQRDVILRAV